MIAIRRTGVHVKHVFTGWQVVKLSCKTARYYLQGGTPLDPAIDLKLIIFS